MAITIESEPQLYTPASNPCVFEFSSTQTAQPSFSFYIELTIDGAVHSYHTVFTGSSNYGRFDCSEILRAYVSSKLTATGSLEVDESSAAVSYKIRVAEKYGTPPVLAGAYVSSGVVNVFNGALRHIDWIDFDYEEHDCTTQLTQGAEWLTYFNYRDEQYFCGINESYFASILCTDTSAELIVTLYDVSGGTIATDTVAVSLSTNNLETFDLSPQSIITNTAVTSTDFDTCYFYEYQLHATGAGVNSGLSSIKRVYIDTECSQYTSRRLHWMNKFGGWESYSFTKYSEETTDVKMQSYEREKGVWQGTSFTYDRGNGERLNYVKTSKDMMKLNSDWISQGKQQWLVKSLLESPQVYLEIDATTFEPVKVTNRNFKLKQRIREGLIREEVTIERTYTYTSQLN